MNSESGKPDWKHLLPVLVSAVLATVIIFISIGSSGGSSCSGSGMITNGELAPVETDCSRPLWIDVIFSWQFTLAGLGVIVGGLYLRKPLLLYVGAFFAIPYNFYAAGAPITYFIPLAFPFLLILSAKYITSVNPAKARWFAFPAMLIMTLACVVILGNTLM